MRYGFGNSGFGYNRPLRGRRTAAAVAKLVNVANNVRVLPNVRTALAAGNEKRVLRSRHFIQPGVTQIAPRYVGYYMSSASPPVETNYGNAITVRCSLEIPGAPGATKVRTFTWDGGAASGTLPDGSDGYSPDLIDLTQYGYGASGTTGYTEAYLVTEYEVPVGGSLPQGSGNQNPAPAGETALFGASTATTKVGTTGTMSTTGGWTATTDRPLPAALIGYTSAPIVSLAVVGDSIPSGQGDQTGDGINTVNTGAGQQRGGYARIAAHEFSGSTLIWAMPIMMITASGDQAARFALTNKREKLLAFATHGLCTEGVNDRGVALSSVAQVLIDQAACWAKMKAYGLKRVEQALITPRSTGTFLDSAGQTATDPANYQLINDNIIAAVASDANLDGYLDMNTGGVADATEPRKWVSTGGIAHTTDGLHPNSTGTTGGHVVMAPIARARLKTYTA